MMPELYGKCRENGSCICDGRQGCIDDTNPLSVARNKPLSKLPKPITLTYDDFSDDEKKEVQADCGYCRRWGHPCRRHQTDKPYEPPEQGVKKIFTPVENGQSHVPDTVDSRSIEITSGKAEIVVQIGSVSVTIKVEGGTT